MKLMTKEVEKKLKKFPLYSQESKTEKTFVCKFFGGSSCTWLVCEGEKQKNGDWLFFGKITLDGHEWEWGYFTLSQLQSIKFKPFGLGVERDLYFN